MDKSVKGIREWVTVALLTAAAFEGIHGMLQLTGLCAGHNPFHPFTGTFYNSGPFACYLALTFPLALTTAVKGRHRWLRIYASVIIMTDAVLLPASLSRTAWLAAATGSLLTFSGEIYAWVKRRSAFNALIIAITAIVFVAWAYRMKQASADGRLLMWKVAASAIDRDPSEGSGWQYVAGKYGEAQERYFESEDRTDNEITVAGAPAYTFNEYLQLSIAYGWGAGLLLALLAIGAIITDCRYGERRMAGTMLAAAIVMGASYPFQFPLSLSTIAVIMATCYLPAIKKLPAAAGLTATLCGTAFLLHDCRKPDINTLFNTAHILHKAGCWKKSNDILFQMMPMTSDPMPLNIIGKNYMMLGMPDSAAYYLRRSAYRCPNRIYPHFLLMTLFTDSLSADPEEALEEALTIIDKREKVQSPATVRMKERAYTVADSLRNIEYGI